MKKIAVALFLFFILISCGVDNSVRFNSNNDENGIDFNGEKKIMSGLQPLGLGTAVSPYLISTLDNLVWISENSSAWDKTYKQTSNIDASATSTMNSGAGFSPIGNATTKFTGSYDGGGFNISNLYISRGSAEYNSGLFGSVSSTDLSNINIVNTDITGGYNTGGIAGLIDNMSNITNCSVSGSISGTSNVGGIAGRAMTSSSVTVSSNSASIISNSDYAGGILGYSANYTTVSNCSNRGTVTTLQYAGGIAGYNVGGYIYNSYNRGSLTAKRYAGGIAGANTYTVENCYSAGNITVAEGGSGDYFGGFIGSNNIVAGAVVSGNYYDSETSGRSDTTGASPLTTINMKNSSSYSGWDFSTRPLWFINSLYNDGYPYLSWERMNVNSPSVQAKDLVLSDLKKDSLMLSWTNGNGLSRIVFVKTGAVTVNVYPVPIDGMTYSCDSSFGTGTSLTNGWYCVYSGTGNNVTVNNLDDDTLYSFQVFEYNGSAGNEVYLRTPASSNPVSERSGYLFEGKGTNSEPFLIQSLDDLKTLSENGNYWNYTFKQTADIDASDTQTWNSGEGFYSIGTSSNNFGGVYYGNGHKVSNLYINRPSLSHIGFFGVISYGIIDNIGIVNANIKGLNYVGGIAGSVNDYTNIARSFTTGSLAGNSYVGGLVGYNADNSNIKDSYSSASITATSNGGGAIGCNSSNSSILNIYSAGVVSEGVTNGGLIGVNDNVSIASSTSFYDSQTSGMSDTGKGVPLTTAEMNTKSTFTDASWAFYTGSNTDTDVWMMDTKNDGYPYFYWEYKLQTITFGSIDSKKYGDADFNLSAVSDSGLTVSYTSLDESVATVTGNSVHITGVGTTTITASQPGNDEYIAAANVTQELTVSKGTASISITNLNFTYDGVFKEPTVTTTPEGLGYTVTYNGVTTKPYNAGTYSVVVTINSTLYEGTASTSMTIAKANPVVSEWPSATNISYGQTLVSSALSGGTASTAGSFAFISPDTAPNAGTSSQSVRFTPTDEANYNTVDGSVNVTVNKAVPTVTQWPTASAITYGETLASSLLNYGYASVSGTFAFVSPTIAPTVGTAAQTVRFTPTDSNNYAYVDGTVNVTVNKATPTVTQWPSASNIIYGQALSVSSLTNGTASVPGTFAFTSPALKPNAGTSLQNITFTPTDTLKYNTVNGTSSVTVEKAEPKVYNWPTVLLTYGQKLSEGTLTGASTLQTGTFTFAKPDDILSSGFHSVTMTFTPDSSNYTSLTGTASATVDKAVLNAIADNKSKSYGEVNPELTISYSGFVNDDNETAITTMPTATTVATESSVSGTYEITVSGGVALNYTFSYVAGVLTVNSVLPTVATGMFAVTTQTASLNGSITSDGGSSITQKGICISLNPDPTILNGCKQDSNIGTSVNVQFTSLAPDMEYHYRTYAVNEKGTAYGEDRSFTTQKAIEFVLGQVFSVNENSSAFTAIGTLTINGDIQVAASYSITSGNDDGIFLINGSTLQVADSTKLDYETATKHILTIKVEDNENTDEGTIRVDLINLNDNTPVLQNAVFTISENAPNGTVAGALTATDADAGLTPLTYTIESGNDDNIFTMNSSTGIITVVDNTNLDYETTNRYVLSVKVSDTLNESIASITIDITDETGTCSEPKEINALPFSENSTTESGFSTVTNYGTGCGDAVYGAEDRIYSYTVNAGEIIDITATPESDYDIVLAIQNECGDGNECKAFTNSGGVGVEETIRYEAPENKVIYIIVEGVGGNGTYTLEVKEAEIEMPDEEADSDIISADEDEIADEETDDDIYDADDETDEDFTAIDENETDDEEIDTDDEVDSDITSADEDEVADEETDDNSYDADNETDEDFISSDEDENADEEVDTDITSSDEDESIDEEADDDTYISDDETDSEESDSDIVKHSSSSEGCGCSVVSW